MCINANGRTFLAPRALLYRRIRCLALVLGCICVGARAQWQTVAAEPSGQWRALVLSGDTTEKGVNRRDWRQTAEFLRRLLESTKRFDVRLCESPVGLTAETLSGFALVVDDYAGALGNTTDHALGEFVASGKGLVVTRAALGSLSHANGASRPGLVELTKASWPAGSGSRLEPFGVFRIVAARSEHEILRGLQSELLTGDQPLRGFTLGTGVEVLARREAGQGEPLLFATASGRGRVFCTALGRDSGAMQEKAYLTTFLRGAEWATSGGVNLPTEIGLPGPATNGLRVLVIAGGHDHEASFYDLFDGSEDLGWPAVTDSKLAFQQDIRSKYDVLVFYDFTRDLDEKGRKNLRDFVESGKGIVVLHHGILNFQKWPWWYEEVVGGLYRLERQGSIPNSTVKFGEQHLIRAAGEHPITAGLTPFRVTDETYKGLFIATNVQPLLVTDNPTSDKTVAWVGPCRTSKVVFIQLGHDHSPFRHPSYRALVHNSILWTAGQEVAAHGPEALRAAARPTPTP